jgi:hypothetical protein
MFTISLWRCGFALLEEKTLSAGMFQRGVSTIQSAFI